ncbi:MAG: tetratricopeptide repeat protein [Mediterranea sp.]|jgi:tetratricopeptide (TPR) repeat protein|nr:tetratricopeptide repeat protein [Mediterranea sp.]
MNKRILIGLCLFPVCLFGQINTERVMMIARNALYFEDYILSIQYFNQVINAKPYLYEPYFYRGLAKINLDDFQGAEVDCDAAIQRNPFVVGAYQIRGFARIRQRKYEGAIEDYKKALEYAPENLTLWHNLALCHIQQEAYEEAENDISSILTIAPKYTRAYLMRGEVMLKQNDTIRALQNFDIAVDMDKYEPDVWAARAILKLRQAKYTEAETDLDNALRLNARNVGNYINRALARFHQNNLRGAMSDYDMALDIDPNNFIGHYNRGLLRAQVGDDNRAIEDFDFVIEIEPDNMPALFNRGLLRAQTGDLRGAINDYSTVIDTYPNFITGYHYRAEAKRQLGDRKGAEADELKILKMDLDRRNGKPVDNNVTATDTAENTETEDNSKTRRKSDRNMNNFRKIVIADDSEAEQRYASDYRGKVQDKNVSVRIEPMYALTYYEKTSDTKRSVHYHKFIDDLNRSGIFPQRLRISNAEAPLTQEQVNAHFALIDTHTSAMMTNPDHAVNRFMRAMDFYLVQDFSGCIEDLTQVTIADDSFFPAYFMRALVRYKQLEYQKAEEEIALASGNIFEKKKETTVGVADYDLIRNDLDRVIALAPDFVYAYYNRGNISASLKDYRAAIADYDAAISQNKDFAEAYFNRGLTHIFLGNNKQGISDLSKAGELGIVSAYNIIKRFTEMPE